MGIGGLNERSRIEGKGMSKQIKLVANSNTKIVINMPNNKVEDFVIKLVKHYTDKYEDAEITIADIEEINK